jgi:hypothetical protein
VYNRRSNKEKWTFMKYIKSFDQIVSYALAIRESRSSVSNQSLDQIQNDFRRDAIYNPRFGESSRVTIQCKIRHIAYFMFGYIRDINNDLKMVYSPLGNLLLDRYQNKTEVAKIFISMLFAIEFKHPYNKMKDIFEVRPFRIIFKLLLDPRLSGRLYNDEVFYYVVFLKKINPSIYETLVSDILTFRSTSLLEKYELFRKNEGVIADALHTWNYTVGTLAGAGIITKHGSREIIGSLKQGKDTKRSYRNEYITLNSHITDFVTRMIHKYPFDEPNLLKNTEKFLYENISEMYNFYPPELIEELGLLNDAEQEKILSILSLTKRIEETSLNANKDDWNRFEKVLEDAFNCFVDVKATVLGGSGRTDLECLYFVKNIKFDVEAKSTQFKLSSINSNRLKLHREKVGSKYTIVITPDYVPAVVTDILGESIVILKSRTFSNLLYQLSVKYGREIRYGFLNDLVQQNMGMDISEHIEEFICSNLSSSVEIYTN